MVTTIGLGPKTYLRDAALVVAGEVPGVGASLDRRLDGGVAHTSLPIGLQLLSVRAAAPCGDPRRGGGVVWDGEAEFLATPGVCVARVVVCNQLGFL